MLDLLRRPEVTQAHFFYDRHITTTKGVEAGYIQISNTLLALNLSTLIQLAENKDLLAELNLSKLQQDSLTSAIWQHQHQYWQRHIYPDRSSSNPDDLAEQLISLNSGAKKTVDRLPITSLTFPANLSPTQELQSRQDILAPVITTLFTSVQIGWGLKRPPLNATLRESAQHLVNDRYNLTYLLAASLLLDSDSQQTLQQYLDSRHSPHTINTSPGPSRLHFRKGGADEQAGGFSQDDYGDHRADADY